MRPLASQKSNRLKSTVDRNNLPNISRFFTIIIHNWEGGKLWDFICFGLGFCFVSLFRFFCLVLFFVEGVSFNKFYKNHGVKIYIFLP